MKEQEITERAKAIVDIYKIDRKEKVGQIDPLAALESRIRVQLRIASGDSVPAETRVSFAEPNQQLFTANEVTELLKEQRRLCGLLVYKNCGVWEEQTGMKIPGITFQMTAERAAEPESKKLSEARSN